MAGITLTTAEAQLALWLEADAAVSKSQTYTINGRSLSRTDAGEITNKIEYWQAWVQRLSGSNRGRRTRQVVPQ